jgi:hypothetical protein
MDDAAFVGGFQSSRNLVRDGQRFVERDGTLLDRREGWNPA